MKNLLLIIAISIIFFSACSEKNEIKAPSVLATGSDTAMIRPDTRITGAQIFLYNGSVRTTNIKADYIEKYDKQDSTLAWGLDVYFYNSEGKQTSHLVADSGLVRELLNIMITNGNVVVVNEEGARLETEQLLWYGNEEMIRTDSFVTIYQDGDTLRGYGLESDQQLKRVKIKKSVSGSIQNVDDLE